MAPLLPRFVMVTLAAHMLAALTSMPLFMTSNTQAAAPADIPLLQPWTGSCGGVPSFDRVRVADFEPALEAAMAKTPDRAVALMEAVWKPAVARVREEVADMQAIADAEGAGIRIEPWDYRFYAEKVRKAKYDLDESEITPYLQLEKLLEGCSTRPANSSAFVSCRWIRRPCRSTTQTSEPGR